MGGRVVLTCVLATGGERSDGMEPVELHLALEGTAVATGSTMMVDPGATTNNVNRKRKSRGVGRKACLAGNKLALSEFNARPLENYPTCEM